MNYLVVVGLTLALFIVMELALGRFLQRESSTRKDWIIELGSSIALPVLILPAVIFGSAWLADALAPGSAGRLASWSLWAKFGVLLIVDDLLQYGWHRLSHRHAWLYRLHRAHHSGEYLSVRTVYRNSLLYYALMPNLWATGVLLHLGFGEVYAIYYIAKMAVIISAHSSVPWDEPLLRRPWLRPLMWIVARVISTPRTHAAHHGKHASDGVTHYKGNYGNFLFVWDVIFSTAEFPDRRPEQYGLEGEEGRSWFAELLWPFGSAPTKKRS